MDIPKIVEEATRAATEAGHASDQKIQAKVEGQIAKQLAGNEEALKTMAAALTREAAARASGSER